MNYKFIIPIEPMGKPRMTRADKWKKRPVVVRYRQYCDRIRDVVGKIEGDVWLVNMKAYLPMKKSFSKKKLISLVGKSHRVKPDIDNIYKGVLDAILKNDSGVCFATMQKMYDDGKGARLELEIGVDL